MTRCPTCDGQIAAGSSLADHERTVCALLAIQRGVELLGGAWTHTATLPALTFAEHEVMATLDDPTLDAAEVARAHGRTPEGSGVSGDHPGPSRVTEANSEPTGETP